MTSKTVALSAAVGAGAALVLLKLLGSSKPKSERTVTLDERNEEGGEGWVYNSAQILNGVVYASGQVAIQVLGPNAVPGVETDCRTEADFCMENLKAVLEASGSDLSKVLRTTCLLADISDYDQFNKIYEAYFPDPATRPARVCFAVGALPLGAKVEVACEAYV